LKDIAIEILNKIYDYGYEAYIVGGFVRDYLSNITSNDIDITTNATPMELKNIFPNIDVDKGRYGSVTLKYRNNEFEITTYRKENEYLDNRHPSSITYVNDLKTDLLRRDFTINTICIDRNNNIIDLLGGIKDLEKKELNTINDASISFKDDSLRILRAIRFAAILDLHLSQEIVNAINEHKHLLKKLSYERKKRELNKIFASARACNGIKLLESFNLDKELELDFSRVKDYSDVVGIWAMINPSKYPFTNSEKVLMKNINEVYDKDNLDRYVLYKYGLYVNLIAGINKGIEKKDILSVYNSLPISERNDIKITVKDICSILNREPDKLISSIYNDLEHQILDNKIDNEKDDLSNYIFNRYQNV